MVSLLGFGGIYDQGSVEEKYESVTEICVIQMFGEQRVGKTGRVWIYFVKARAKVIVKEKQ